MLINKEYIIQRIAGITSEKMTELNVSDEKNRRLYKLKLRFPIWLRVILFHPLNPVYSVWKQYTSKKKKRGVAVFPPHNSFAVDFVKYCYENDPYFETKDFFDNQDAEIELFIDNRIKCLLAGFFEYPTSEEQEEENANIAKLKKNIKISGDFYRLDQPSGTCYLPNSFDVNIFYYQYGLRDMPHSLKEYIAGKDFIDIGAFTGDSSLMFLQYSPNQVYAYEPVSDNFKLLTKTIRKNNAINKIQTIQKGLGDKITTLDINVSLSSSSLLSEKKDGLTEKIVVTTLDEECENRKVGLIKMDVEGFEYYVVKGSSNTITRDKPVLLISIYHTGKDFFEIPPLIRSYYSGYKFKFFDLVRRNPIFEKIIIAYPEELDKI